MFLSLSAKIGEKVYIYIYNTTITTQSLMIVNFFIQKESFSDMVEIVVKSHIITPIQALFFQNQSQYPQTIKLKNIKN